MIKKMTMNEGFQAMIKFLEKWYKFTKSDDIAFLLSGMGMDSAFWQDWVESVNSLDQNSKKKVD